jgi:hypothetical protein
MKWFTLAQEGLVTYSYSQDTTLLPRQDHNQSLVSVS